MKKYSFLFSFFLIQFVYSQQFNTNVVVNFESVNQTNNSVFKNLENSIKLFVENTKWSEDKFDEHELINLNIFFNVTRFSENFFIGNMEFQSDRPVLNSTYSTQLFKYVDKNTQFEYVEFEPIDFNEMAKNWVRSRFPNLPENDEEFQKWVRKRSELLFYRLSEIMARSELVEKIQPDLVLCIEHLNKI